MDNRNNYTGYTWDVTLELYFAQARFYDAENHRFTQEDPVKDGGNWYVYVGNDPLGAVDPTGLIMHSRLNDLARDGALTGITNPDPMSQSRFQMIALEVLASSGISGFHNIAQIILFSWMWKSGRFNLSENDLRLEYNFYDANKPTDGNLVRADAVGVRSADGIMEIFEVKPAWHLSVPQKYSEAVTQLTYYTTLGCGQRAGQNDVTYKAVPGGYLYLGSAVTFYEDTSVIYRMHLNYKGGVIGYRIERTKKDEKRKNSDLRVQQAIEEMEVSILPRYRAGLDTDVARALGAQFGEQVLIVGYASVAAYAAGSAMVGGSIVTGLTESVVVSDAVAKRVAVEAAKEMAGETMYMLFIQHPDGTMIALKALYDLSQLVTK